ncbi:hypothetical protein [Desulfococcus sp.]|uniref:hypothetical protein n=1 Tax=Desulfococcus sp. TaxID=2025834 RepID=UPI0035940E84
MLEDSLLISEWNDRLPGDVTAILIRAGNAQDDPFLEFCRIFKKWAPKVDFIPADVPGKRAPAIEIRPGLRYRAIPAGPELGPFLDALSGPPSEPMPEADLAEAPAFPMRLTLYIADRCPFCPGAVRSLLPLTADGGPADLTIVDAGRFPEDAAADGVRSVPALVFRDPVGGDRICWTGTLSIPEILGVAASRDPSRLGAESMASMIEAGDAAGLADMMLQKGMIFPAFLELLTHEKWPTRLGAMVAAETLAEKSPKLGACLIEPLWALFPAAEEAVQGDILYLLGTVGDAGILGRLASVISGPHPTQVKEAAREAVAAIRSGSQRPQPDDEPFLPTQRRNG